MGADGYQLPTEPFPGSVLLSRAQQKQLNQWTGKPGQIWKRCYLKSTDPNTASAFHSQCNNQGPSFSIFKSNDGPHNQARLFGGYTEVSWGGSNTYNGYDTPFLFVLEPTLERFPFGGFAPNQGKSIYDHVNYGPTFGSGHDLHINSNMQLGYCNFPQAYACDKATQAPNTDCTNRLCGVATFSTVNVTLDEIEVWVLQ